MNESISLAECVLSFSYLRQDFLQEARIRKFKYRDTLAFPQKLNFLLKIFNESGILVLSDVRD